jgi:predicted PurR-regulated permease PerM
VEYFKASAQKAYPLRLTDPEPIKNTAAIWRAVAQFSTIGVFFLLLCTALVLARTVLVPVATGIIIGAMLTPAAERFHKFGVPPVLTSFIFLLLSAAALYLVVSMLATTFADWIGNAQQIAAGVKEKLHVLDRPINALRNLQQSIAPDSAAKGGVNFGMMDLLQPTLTFVTPAIGQVVVFFGTLFFFLLGQEKMRRSLVIRFKDRDDRLRALRIMNDVEHNLTGYLGVVSIIYAVMGVLTSVIAYAVGMPNWWTWGVLAFVLNFVPYLGPLIMVVILFVAGLVNFATLSAAFIAPVLYIGLATLEGHFVTPSILGRKLTLSPMAVFLALVAWTWLWGPVGAFLAVPLLIIAMTVIVHIFPKYESNIPG